MDKTMEYPTVTGIFENGYGDEIAQALADSIEHYARGMEVLGCSVDSSDVENIVNLVWLLKAVLKDVHGIDIK